MARAAIVGLETAQAVLRESLAMIRAVREAALREHSMNHSLEECGVDADTVEQGELRLVPRNLRPLALRSLAMHVFLADQLKQLAARQLHMIDVVEGELMVPVRVFADHPREVVEFVWRPEDGDRLSFVRDAADPFGPRVTIDLEALRLRLDNGLQPAGLGDAGVASVADALELEEPIDDVEISGLDGLN